MSADPRQASTPVTVMQPAQGWAPVWPIDLETWPCELPRCGHPHYPGKECHCGCRG